jgi:aspartyl-tRNA(Asn)/glutamyl-tRNA(Gln) amidotransferase subunit B
METRNDAKNDTETEANADAKSDAKADTGIVAEKSKSVIGPSGKTYYPVIGLEIHAELKTKSKMFCSCANNADEPEQNKNICAVCMGHPGTLPVLNKAAIKHVIRVGVAVGADIADYTEWDRKNYFYPDIPKGYQISQFAYPLVKNGGVSVKGFDSSTGEQSLHEVKLTRIHLEEDTASSSHDHPQDANGQSYSLVDFNRAGVPLMELVTEPVIHDAKTAGNFAKELQLLLRELGAGDANMEKGEMRVEANISVSPDPRAHDFPYDFKHFGRKVEVKNLNSFRSVERSIDFEIARHIDILERAEILKNELVSKGILAEKTGESSGYASVRGLSSDHQNTLTDELKKAGLFIAQETRGFDETTGKTFSQRAKEDSHDYRYFPDPDLPKLFISEIPEFNLEKIKAELPKLPWASRAAYLSDFGMKEEDAEMFVQNEIFRSFFEGVAKILNDNEKTKLAVNYITSDIAGLVKKSGIESSQKSGSTDAEYLNSLLIRIQAAAFSEIISMLKAGELSSRGAKDLIALYWSDDESVISDISSKNPKKIAEEKGFIIKNDPEALKKMIIEVVDSNPTVLADYKAGKEASLQFFVGQIMKMSKGSVNPAVAKEEILKIVQTR